MFTASVGWVVVFSRIALAVGEVVGSTALYDRVF
jgi:hypothetical protein